MRAADQWTQIEKTLDPDWSEAQLSFTPEGSDRRCRCGPRPAPTGPISVNTFGCTSRALEEAWSVPATSSGASTAGASGERWRSSASSATWRPQLRRRRMRQHSLSPPPGTGRCRSFLRTGATCCATWSSTRPTTYPRAALLGAPLNPSRVPGETALRFRASGKQGYGVSPVMARRCFERMDAEGITGSLNVLYDLSDTGNAVTQGPVWRLAGRSV